MIKKEPSDYQTQNNQDYSQVQSHHKNKKSFILIRICLTVHHTHWKDLLIKPQLIKALKFYGLQYPSQVQMRCIPWALQGYDILCQAKNGMGKTAVFVLSILNNLITYREKRCENFELKVGICIVITHTRELAYQILNDFKKLGLNELQGQFVQFIKVSVFYGGVPIQNNKKQLKEYKPHIIVSTPGRLYDLMINFQKQIYKQSIFLNVMMQLQSKIFVIDECDKILQNLKMRTNIGKIYMKTPANKQVMMFSATMRQVIKEGNHNLIECRRFMNNQMEVYLNQSQLILFGITHYYILLPQVNNYNQRKKFSKLILLLDTVRYIQVIVYVNKIQRAVKLTELLEENCFNPICIHSRIKQQLRIENYNMFKHNNIKVMVATDILGRGIDIQNVDFIINYEDRETYLHRVGRAGRFGTKGLAINFVRSDMQQQLKEEKQKPLDKEILQRVQESFKIKIPELTTQINLSKLLNIK